MLSILPIVLIVWLVSVAAWYMISRMYRSVDVGRMKERILDKPKKTAAAQQPARQLLQTEDMKTGRVAVRLLQRFQLLRRLEETIEQAGLKWRPARVVHASLALFLIGFLVARQVAPALLPLHLGAGLLAAVLPLIYIRRVRARRLFRFEELFPDSLEFVARSMRAGHAFSVSLEMIHREFQDPLASEFRRTFDEHNLGLPLDTALLKLSKRVPLLDVHFFVSAVLLQKRTGGNLAEILDKLAYVIRERFKLRGKIRAISAHGRMTASALSCIPIAVAVMMFFSNPDYISFFLEDETGHVMLGVIVMLQLTGYAIMRKITQIEV